jgi:hypothetical protein
VLTGLRSFAPRPPRGADTGTFGFSIAIDARRKEFKQLLLLLQRQRIHSRFDFGKCAYNSTELALLVQANEQNPDKIDIVKAMESL